MINVPFVYNFTTKKNTLFLTKKILPTGTFLYVPVSKVKFIERSNLKKLNIAQFVYTIYIFEYIVALTEFDVDPESMGNVSLWDPQNTSISKELYGVIVLQYLYQ